MFIVLELDLEEVGHSSATQEVKLIAGNEIPHRPLADAGTVGVLLYCVLIIWWLMGKVVIKADMPRPLVKFYMAGIFTSFFIAMYGTTIVSDNEAFGMLVIVLVMAAAASYILHIVIGEVGPGIWGVIVWVSVKARHLYGKKMDGTWPTLMMSC